MANEMPKSDRFTGLARKVMEYSEHFAELVEKSKRSSLSDADWAPIEALVDVVGLDVGPETDAEHRKFPDRPYMIGEYAAATMGRGRRFDDIWRSRKAKLGYQGATYRGLAWPYPPRAVVSRPWRSPRSAPSA
jgi:transposase